MRLRLLAAFATVAVLLAGVSMASAASMSVTSGELTVRTAGACTGSTISVTRTDPQYFLWFILVGYRGVRLDDLPTACQGKPIRVTAAGTSGADATVTAGASSGSITIGLDATYGTNVTSFPLTIGGWHVPTSL